MLVWLAPVPVRWDDFFLHRLYGNRLAAVELLTTQQELGRDDPLIRLGVPCLSLEKRKDSPSGDKQNGVPPRGEMMGRPALWVIVAGDDGFCGRAALAVLLTARENGRRGRLPESIMSNNLRSAVHRRQRSPSVTMPLTYSLSEERNDTNG